MRFAWVVLSSCLALTPVVAAQSVPAAQDLALARSLFLEGVEAARAEDWARAEDRFARSYALAESEPNAASTLLNLARVQAEAGRFVESNETYRRFLQVAPRPLRARHERDVEGALRAGEAQIARLTIVDAPTDGAVTLDGRALAPAHLGVAIPVNPGSHQILVGGCTTPIHVSLAPGQATSVPAAGCPDAPPLRVARIAPVEPTTPTTRTPPIEATHDSPAPHDDTALHVALVAVAGVLIAAGAVTWIAVEASRPQQTMGTVATWSF